MKVKQVNKLKNFIESHQPEVLDNISIIKIVNGIRAFFEENVVNEGMISECNNAGIYIITGYEPTIELYIALTKNTKVYKAFFTYEDKYENPSISF